MGAADSAGDDGAGGGVGGLDGEPRMRAAVAIQQMWRSAHNKPNTTSPSSGVGESKGEEDTVNVKTLLPVGPKLRTQNSNPLCLSFQHKRRKPFISNVGWKSKHNVFFESNALLELRNPQVQRVDESGDQPSPSGTDEIVGHERPSNQVLVPEHDYF